jgi:hypothetical protein
MPVPKPTSAALAIAVPVCSWAVGAEWQPKQEAIAQRWQMFTLSPDARNSTAANATVEYLLYATYRRACGSP